MKSPSDAESARVEPDGIVKLLASYFYFQERDLDALAASFAPYPVEIMADSGGFSAWSLGKSITLEGYIAWCQQWKHRLHCYAVLDDLLDGKRTWENQKEMERNGLAPLPIFHYGEDWSWLDRYMADYPYIMLGGMAGVRERSWIQAMPWLIQCFKRGEGRVVFHGLGVSAQRVLNNLPFYSADASTYLNAAKYGMIGLFDPTRNTWEFVRTNGENISPYHLSLLRFYGLSEHMLRVELPEAHKQHMAQTDRSGASPFNTTITSVGAASWHYYEAYLRRRHGVLHIPGRSDLPGLRYYLVVNVVRVLQSSPANVGLKAVLARYNRLEDAT